LTIDIDHIEDREMTRFFEHAAAAIVAILVTATTMVTVVTVPEQPAVVEAAAPLLV
jgi:hypothetical protein